MIKAIVSDLDGTLLDRHKKIGKETLQDLKLAHEKGFLFGLSTGREIESVKRSLVGWGLTGLVDFIIASNGGEAADLVHGQSKTFFPLEGKMITQIFDAYRDLKVGFAAPRQGALYGPKRTLLLSLMSRSEKTPFIKMEPSTFLGQDYSKVMVVCSPRKMERVERIGKLFQSQNPTLCGVKTAPVLYEFFDHRVSKSEGLRWAGQAFGLTLDEMMCFGDADNDLDMVQNAGIGVAMANASPLLLQTARSITLSNDQEGVGKYLEATLLKEEASR